MYFNIICLEMKKDLFVLLGCVFCSAANASDEALTRFPRGLESGVGVSATSGLNLFIGYYNNDFESYWLRHFGFRIDLATTDPLKSALDSAIESFMGDGVDVGDGVRIDDGKLDAWHGGLLMDYYPFAGNWRLTAGYVWGGARLDASIFGTVENAPAHRFYFYLAGDHYYYNGNTFNGVTNIDWNYNGPYLGTGFDIGVFCGFHLYIDAGVVFTNRTATFDLDIPHENLYLYNKDSGVWSPVTIPKLDQDVQLARDEANRDLANFKFFPMIKMGFGYRF